MIKKRVFYHNWCQIQQMVRSQIIKTQMFFCYCFCFSWSVCIYCSFVYYWHHTIACPALQNDDLKIVISHSLSQFSGLVSAAMLVQCMMPPFYFLLKTLTYSKWEVGSLSTSQHIFLILIRNKSMKRRVLQLNQPLISSLFFLHLFANFSFHEQLTCFRRSVSSVCHHTTLLRVPLTTQYRKPQIISKDLIYSSVQEKASSSFPELCIHK